MCARFCLVCHRLLSKEIDVRPQTADDVLVNLMGINDDSLSPEERSPGMEEKREGAAHGAARARHVPSKPAYPPFPKSMCCRRRPPMPPPQRSQGSLFLNAQIAITFVVVFCRFSSVSTLSIIS